MTEDDSFFSGIKDQLQDATAAILVTATDDDGVRIQLHMTDSGAMADVDDIPPSTVALIAKGAEVAAEQYGSFAIGEATDRTADEVDAPAVEDRGTDETGPEFKTGPGFQ